MCKFIKECVYVLFLLMILEFVSFNKDYDQLLIISNYVAYDIENNNISSFSTSKYEVFVEHNKYKIVYYRRPIFNIKILKYIEYHGII